jgi:hypothetical protein
MKFCKDCTHFLPLSEICNSQWSITEMDPIWGRSEKLTAREMRNDSTKCGMGARFHEDMYGFKKYISEGVIE